LTLLVASTIWCNASPDGTVSLVIAFRFRHRGTFISEIFDFTYGSLRCVALIVNERMFPFPYMASVNIYSRAISPFSRDLDLPVPDTRQNRQALTHARAQTPLRLPEIALMAIDLISYIKVV